MTCCFCSEMDDASYIMKFILGRKLGMTRVFNDEGRHVAVTRIAVLPSVVSQIKTKESDGYKAVQIKAHKTNKTERVTRTAEFREDAPGRYKAGEAVTLKQFKKDELVTVEGKSKGKGFAGTIKRHGFQRGPKTHGSNNVRQPGSIGGGYPQRVVLGRRMAGHMGTNNVTVKNLEIIDVDDVEGILLIAGAVPGPVKSIVKIYGKGEKAEEEVDFVALEEQRAKKEMLAQEEKAEPNEQKTHNESNEPTE